MPQGKLKNKTSTSKRPVDGALAEEIWELFQKGVGRNEISRIVDLHPQRVSATIKARGGRFDAAIMRNANAAMAARQIERRLALVDRLYTRAEALLDRLSDEEFATIMKERGGAERARKLPFVPANDERAIANALSSLLNSALHLQEKKSDNPTSEQQSLMEDLALQLGIDDRGDAQRED